MRLVSPAIVPDLNTIRAKFFARGSTGYTLIVGTMDTPTGTFTQKQIITLTGTNALYSVSFADYAGTDTYIAFKHGLGGTYRSIYIDDVLLEEIQAIPPELTTLVFPLDMLLTLNNPLLSWTPSFTGEPATGYKVYMDENNPPVTEVYDGTNISFQTSGLSLGSSYYWQVIPYNANGDATGVSTWTFSIVVDGQLAESFEPTSFPPLGWGNPGAWSRSTTTPLHGTASAYKYTSTTENLLRTPLLTMSSNSTIDFFAHTTSSNTGQRLQVQYSSDGSSWTDIGAEISLPSAGPWAQYTVDLSSLDGHNYYLAFATYNSGTAGYVYLDHIIGPQITPIIPDAVTLVSPADAATDVISTPSLSWTPAATGGIPTGYKIYLDESADPSTLYADVTASPYNVNPLLNYETTYYWKVVAYNGAGDGAASAIRSFTTQVDPTVTPPITQDFAGTFPPTDWLRYSGLLDAPSTLIPITSGWIQDDWRNVTSPVNKAARVDIYGTSVKYWLMTLPIDLGDGSTDMS